MSCYCLCKDTNSQASHNSHVGRTNARYVVIAYAKIQYTYYFRNGCYCPCKDKDLDGISKNYPLF